MEKQDRFVKGIFFVLFFFAAVLAGTLLKMMDSVFKPVMLSMMLAFIFYPFVKRLSAKYKFPWWLATVTVYVVALVVVVLFANLLSSSFKSVALAVPKYEERFSDLQMMVRHWLSADPDSKLYLWFNFDEDASLFANINSQLNILELLKNTAVGFTGSVVGFMKTFFLVVLLSIFLLMELKMMKQKIGVAFGSEGESRVYSIIQNIVSDVTHYVSIKFVISLATGLSVFLLCICFGMDFPLVWAFTAFCFNFIPTFGSIFSSGVTILFACVQFYPSLWIVFFFGVLIIGINFVFGNILEPKIEGENLGISPFVILISLSLWGWLWGILGMILAVPFVVIIKIICENVSYLKPVAVFLGSKA